MYFATFLKPCDLILSSGTKMSGKQILKFAYDFKKLNYKNYFSINKKFIRKNEVKTLVGSNIVTKQKLRKFRWKPKIYGKKIVRKIYNSL